jgi:hypothetical protein
LAWLSFALLCFKQLPAVSFFFQSNTEIRIPFDLVRPLAIVVQLLRELNPIDFEVTTKPITAGFGQFVAGHWLPVFAENFQALQLTGCHCWLDSLGRFVRCDWIAVAGDWGGGFGAVEES